MAIFNALSLEVGVSPACEALQVSRATVYRQQARQRHLGAIHQAPVRHRRQSPLAQTEAERQCIRDVLCSERFADCAPSTVYAKLLDEGRHIGSIRTMYRVLAGDGQSRERRNQCVHPAYAKPELLATRPNEVWSWDISKLRGPTKWTYFHLYVIIDIFSRYVVGWMVAHRETAELAELLISDTIAKQGIERNTLTLHADRGSSMRSKPVAALLVDLGVEKTHSRPYVSDDNPYSEAHFKTLKYRPEFPDRFGAIEHARGHCQQFFTWYNAAHYHSGIALMTPEVMHYGRAAQVQMGRQAALDAAFRAHPNRFKGRAPKPPELPVAAWINPPRKEPAAQPKMPK